MREMKYFPSNMDDLRTIGFVPKHEHIGEAVPIGEDGSCAHKYLAPNINRTHCILPQRIDIGKHFITTGGPDAIREPFEKMISRVSSFGRYMFEKIDEYPVVLDLFNQDTFQNAAKSVCPADKQHLDPFQFNFIMQVPGQTVATHIDGAYFWGASRKDIPQWLLACMVFSGLFKDKFVDQVQVVGYLHDWQPKPSDGGTFVYYNTDSSVPDVMHPVPRAGAIIDGSKTVHAAVVYKGHVDAPLLNKDKRNELVYAGDEKWHLIVGDDVTHVYDTSDLRMSIVYRARCFKSESEKKHYYNLPAEEQLSLDYILTTLTNDLVNRKRHTRKHLDSLSKLDLAMLLMDEYIAYPLPPKEQALNPFNYCALSKELPFLAPLLSLIC